MNGASCFNSHTSATYYCQCPNGFAGTNCETFEYCSDEVCRNGGTCFSSALNSQKFICVCAPGFAGETCEIFTGCAADPCLNGGSCNTIDSMDTFLCLCDNPFVGDRCQYFLSCDNDPCGNGGTCYSSDSGIGYFCSCALGYKGAHCETTVETCSGDPCLNEGTCYNKRGGNGYLCKCTSVFTGDNCQLQNRRTRMDSTVDVNRVLTACCARIMILAVQTRVMEVQRVLHLSMATISTVNVKLEHLVQDVFSMSHVILTHVCLMDFATGQMLETTSTANVIPLTRANTVKIETHATATRVMVGQPVRQMKMGRPLNAVVPGVGLVKRALSKVSFHL
ncbi:delta-like protein A isoform X4 [Anneissia japonica]|uniref:delta-like protein A isoform X4 n=1 Tax=Anneissia japonica TaxID=1529436 RepID=UPI001425B7BE|nr:delta-like protein A isoform X4 [Anneissia japonica]